MKKLVLLILIVLAVTCFAAEYDFTLSIQNQQVSGTDFIFDIYMLRTGTTDIYLGDSDFVLTFNSGNFTTPDASMVTAESRIFTWYTMDASIVATNRVILNISKAPFSNQTQFNDRMQVIGTSGNGTLIGQIKITNITTPSGTAGLQWRTADENHTIVNRIDTADPWAQHNIDAFATYSNPGDYSLPVELSSFTATSTPQGIVLQWSTESETDNLGYILEKQVEGNNSWVVAASYKTDDALKGKGNTTVRQNYSYTDSYVQSDKTYTYRLYDVNKQGVKSLKQSAVVRVNVVIPKTTDLLPSYPNPFNPETTIRYDLAQDATVDLFIVDILGRTVATLIDGQKVQAGSWDIRWNGVNDAGNKIASGAYLVIFKAGSVTKVNKVVLLR
ncbi:MAG TPA: FlgD immunoglobulin-like domain containing protein [bacterium]|nr:FlgD immunoglobulin-like domain containing protein [bacterium]HPN42507.1 FlgD immunoglobulin-like domain containing protein [bacterium]